MIKEVWRFSSWSLVNEQLELPWKFVCYMHCLKKNVMIYLRIVGTTMVPSLKLHGPWLLRWHLSSEQTHKNFAEMCSFYLVLNAQIASVEGLRDVVVRLVCGRLNSRLVHVVSTNCRIQIIVFLKVYSMVATATGFWNFLTNVKFPDQLN